MKAYDFTDVLLGMVCCAMSIFLLPAKAAAQSPSTEAALYQAVSYTHLTLPTMIGV